MERKSKYSEAYKPEAVSKVFHNRQRLPSGIDYARPVSRAA